MQSGATHAATDVDARPLLAQKFEGGTLSFDPPPERSHLHIVVRKWSRKTELHLFQIGLSATSYYELMMMIVSTGVSKRVTDRRACDVACERGAEFPTIPMRSVGTTATSVARRQIRGQLVLHDWDFNFPAMKREFDDARHPEVVEQGPRRER